MDAVARSVRRGGAQRGESQWRAPVTKQAASGESVATFCAQEAVSLSSFRRWRRRLQGEGSLRRAAATDFVELGTLDGVAPASGRLELTLEFGGGVVLRLVRG
jgi:hypothetical protein